MSTLLTLLFILLSIKSLDALCPNILINSPGQTSQCGTALSFSQTSFTNMPVGATEILIEGRLQVPDQCSLSQPFHFAVLTIEPTPGNVVKIMDLVWDGNHHVDLQLQESVGGTLKTVSLMDSFSDASLPGYGWFSFVGSISLSKKKAFLHFYENSIIIFGTGVGSFNPTSTWTLDMNPKLTVCSDVNGANAFKCNIAQLKIVYQYPTNEAASSGSYGSEYGSDAVLAGQYRFLQESGYTISDLTNTLGSAYLGSSTSSAEYSVAANKPIWIPFKDGSGNPPQDLGAKFQSGTEYITLPRFTIDQTGPGPFFTFSVQIWLKINSAPTSDVYLFRYSNAALTEDLFFAKITQAGAIHMGSSGFYDTSADGSLSFNTWNSIMLTFTVQASRFASSQLFINGVKIALTFGASSVINPLSFQSTDVVRIGGPPSFSGTISTVEIYNPGSRITFTPSCQSSTCEFDMGISFPSKCGLPKCHSSCAACFGSEQTNCLSCQSNYGLIGSTCVYLSSPSGQYYDGTSNQACSTGCDRCVNSTLCVQCKNGFTKFGSVCCSSVDANGNCMTCHSSCATCSGTTANDCLSCTAPLVKSGTTCVATCPSNQFNDNGNCVTCHSSCATCKGSTADDCLSCSSSKSLSGSRCEQSDSSSSPSLVAIIIGSVAGSLILLGGIACLVTIKLKHRKTNSKVVRVQPKSSHMDAVAVKP